MINPYVDEKLRELERTRARRSVPPVERTRRPVVRPLAAKAGRVMHRAGAALERWAAAERAGAAAQR